MFDSNPVLTQFYYGNLHEVKKINCNKPPNECSIKKEELITRSNSIQDDVNTFSDKVNELLGGINTQHNTFRNKINQNNNLQKNNDDLSNQISKIEAKEDSSYGMIETYKKKYYSTIVELVMIIVCVLYLMFLLFMELSKNNK